MISNLILSAQEGDKWWLAGGIHPSQVVAAFQPKGAVDLAASYINLNNPGTNNATVGTLEPLFSSSYGWQFDGSSNYFLVGPTANSSGFAIRYTNASVASVHPAGVRDGNHRVSVIPIGSSGAEHGFYNSKDAIARTASPQRTDGVLLINRNNGAYNGEITADTNPADAEPALQYFIGAHNANGSIGLRYSGEVQAVIFFASGVTLTGAQISAISSAMAAL